MSSGVERWSWALVENFIDVTVAVNAAFAVANVNLYRCLICHLRCRWLWSSSQTVVDGSFCCCRYLVFFIQEFDQLSFCLRLCHQRLLLSIVFYRFLFSVTSPLVDVLVMALDQMWVGVYQPHRTFSSGYHCYSRSPFHCGDGFGSGKDIFILLLPISFWNLLLRRVVTLSWL